MLPVLFVLAFVFLPQARAPPPDVELPKPKHVPKPKAPKPPKHLPPGQQSTPVSLTPSTVHTPSTFPVFSLTTSLTSGISQSTIIVPKSSTISAEPQTTTPASTEGDTGNGISSGAKAGIGIGVVLAVVLLIGGGALEVYLKQSRAIAASKEQDPFRDPRPGEVDELDSLGHGGKKVYPVDEKASGVPRVYQPYRPGAKRNG